MTLEGQIAGIGEIPNQENPRGEDVRFFFGTLKLDRSTPGLKPGMSAVVTFELPHRQGVIALPNEAVIADVDNPICYVLAGDHLERRKIQLGQTTTDLIEITEGLEEGEEVVLDPPGRVTRPRTLAGFDSRPLPKEAFTKVAVPKAKRSGRAGGGYGGGGGAGGAWRKGGGEPGGGGQWNKGGGAPGGGTRKYRKKAVEDE